MENHIICPHCGEHNNPEFKTCWKCSWSFLDGKLSDIPLTQRFPQRDSWVALSIVAVLGAILIWSLMIPRSSPPEYVYRMGEGEHSLSLFSRAQLAYQEYGGKGVDKWLPIRPGDENALKKLWMDSFPESFFVYGCDSDSCTAWISREWEKGNYQDYLKLRRDGVWECGGVYKKTTGPIKDDEACGPPNPNGCVADWCVVKEDVADGKR